MNTGMARGEFLELTRKSKGRPGNLSPRERTHFAYLVKKAATGNGDGRRSSSSICRNAKRG